MFSIGIVAHEKRRSYAEALADKVNSDFISWDDGTLGCNRNHLEVYRRLAEAQCEYAVVLEDDALPIEDDFLGQLDSALSVAPAPLVSLYLGTSRPSEYQGRIQRALGRAQREQANWVVGKRLLHAVGVAIPVKMIESMLEFMSQVDRSVAIDEAIGQWAGLHSQGGLSICYTVPSLVDHRDEETLFLHPDGRPRVKPRRAWQLGARTHWDSSSVRL